MNTADSFPRWYDWLWLVSVIVTLVLNWIAVGPAGVVVMVLLLFAAYKLGKALGR